MSFRSGVFLVAAALATMTCQAAARTPQSGTLRLDPAKTLIEFRLPGSLHTTHGKFKLERGTISADLATGQAGGLIVVDATSGDSGIESRDKRMKDSVLEVQNFPEITFAPKHVIGQIDGKDQFHANLQGILKLHGAEHLITIEVRGQLSGNNLVAESHFSVPYVAWGMKDPGVLFLTVAKEVDIDIATEGNVGI
jgi:polyisoprenoid-binding protein YceI